MSLEKRHWRWLVVAAALACLAAVDVLTERRERVKQMTPEQKQMLLDNQQRLEKLEPEKQRRLREFAAALEQDPQADRLREIMLHYDAWAQRLPMEKRSELLQLADDARLARVKQLASEAARYAAQRLGEQDAKLVAAWIERRVLEGISPEQRARLEQVPAPERRHMVARLLWQRGQQNGTGLGISLRPQDLQSLGEKLSPAAKRQLAQAAGSHRAMQLVGDWIRQSLGVNNPGGRGGGMPNWGAGEFRRFPRRDSNMPAGPLPLRPPGDEPGRAPRKPPPAQPEAS